MEKNRDDFDQNMGIIKGLTTEEEYKERGRQAAENFTREFYEKFGITSIEGIAGHGKT